MEYKVELKATKVVEVEAKDCMEAERKARKIFEGAQSRYTSKWALDNVSAIECIGEIEEEPVEEYTGEIDTSKINLQNIRGCGMYMRKNPLGKDEYYQVYICPTFGHILVEKRDKNYNKAEHPYDFQWWIDAFTLSEYMKEQDLKKLCIKYIADGIENHTEIIKRYNTIDFPWLHKLIEKLGVEL